MSKLVNIRNVKSGSKVRYEDNILWLGLSMNFGTATYNSKEDMENQHEAGVLKNTAMVEVLSE